MRTNGILFPDSLDLILEAGVSHLTITINAVDSSIGKQISWILFAISRRLIPAVVRNIINVCLNIKLSINSSSMLLSVY